MKKLIVLIALFAGIASFNSANAQVAVSVNIGLQPLWGPIGYDYVEYYYLPEIDMFYYVPTEKFVYWNGFQWVFISQLPRRYHVNLYSTYKVVVNEPQPYMHHDVYVTKYKNYKSEPQHQVIIRDSDDPKYNVVKGHPQHNQSVNRDNNNSGGVYKDNGSKSGEGQGKVTKPSTRVEKKVERKSTNDARKADNKKKKDNKPESK